MLKQEDSQALILVVDEPAIATMLDFFLTSRGFNVLSAFDLAEAQRCLWLNDVSVLLIDLAVPNARDFVIGAKQENPNITLCYMGDVSGRDKPNADDIWIRKPFNFETLVDVLSEALN